jgi:hypothetical protein
MRLARQEIYPFVDVHVARRKLRAWCCRVLCIVGKHLCHSSPTCVSAPSWLPLFGRDTRPLGARHHQCFSRRTQQRLLAVKSKARAASAPTTISSPCSASRLVSSTFALPAENSEEPFFTPAARWRRHSGIERGTAALRPLLHRRLAEPAHARHHGVFRRVRSRQRAAFVCHFGGQRGQFGLCA